MSFCCRFLSFFDLGFLSFIANTSVFYLLLHVVSFFWQKRKELLMILHLLLLHVTTLMANGYMINRALCIMGQLVEPSRKVRTVSPMANLIWVISSGGGNPVNAHFQGLTLTLFSNSLKTST